jgi:hypothetical protein
MGVGVSPAPTDRTNRGLIGPAAVLVPRSDGARDVASGSLVLVREPTRGATMNRLLIVFAATAVAAVPAAFGLAGNVSFAQGVDVRIPASATLVPLTDDHGGDSGSSEPGDDRGGASTSSTSAPLISATPSSSPRSGEDRASTSAEPGDDHGGSRSPASEPGDDNGGQSSHSEPADDHGGHTGSTTPSPSTSSDDSGGHSSGDGSGSGHGGGDGGSGHQ